MLIEMKFPSIRLLVVLSFFASSVVFGDEIALEKFFLPLHEIGSEGSVIYYSDSLVDIESERFLLIEAWNYDSERQTFEYFCIVKYGNTVHRLKSTSRTEGDIYTTSVCQNDTITLSIKTIRSAQVGYESLTVEGKVILTSAGSKTSFDVVGLVVV